jgi:hypothetical protein
MLRKATVSFVVFVRLSVPVRMEQLGFHWTDFYETLYLSIFLKFVEKSEDSLRRDKDDGHFT